MDTAQFGQVTTGDTSRHALSSLTGAPKEGLMVALKAKSTNTGVITLLTTDSGDANAGWELTAGEGIGLDVINSGKIWVLQSVGADRLCWAVVKG